MNKGIRKSKLEKNEKFLINILKNLVLEKIYLKK